MTRKKLAIVSTHPIQYYAPVFRALAASGRVEPRVFYTWSQTAAGAVADSGFGTQVRWDVPLLEGYGHEFVPNVAKRPGPEHFFGIRNPSLIRAIDNWSADALLVYGWNLHAHLKAMRHFKGRIPVLFRGDSTLLGERSAWKTKLRRAVLNQVYRSVDVAISVGSNSRDYFAWCGIPRQRIAFAPHSVDTRRFADPHGTHAAMAAGWREELNIAPDELVFVYAGKLMALKEPNLLLDAFLRLPLPAHLVFVGNGALELEIKEKAQGHGNVHFLPFQNQSAMPAVYRLGRVFVLPSRSETWGLALNEAMASGCALIASSKVGAARDLIRHGGNGWIFESGNGQALTAILQTAAEAGHERLQAIGAEGQRMVQEWSTEEAARRIADAVLDSIHN